MPAIPREKLIAHLEESFRASGYQSLLLEPPLTKPFRFVVYNESESFNLLIYVWSLTQGGGAGRSRDDEYKIQMTLTDWQRGLVHEEGATTLLLGWSEADHIWAGFDASYHQHLTGRSNMVSLYGDTLEKARQGQLGIHIKKNQEIAVAIPPFFLVDYAKNAEQWHNYVQQPDTLEAIEAAIAQDSATLNIVDIDIAERLRIARTILQPYRNRRFRYNITSVYQNRCALTGMQLDVVDAAHIIDVVYPESTDEIKNGLCLSALCHRAFDAGLVGITPDYRIVLNQDAIADLQQRGVADGLEQFKQMLSPRLILPPDQQHHPSPEYLGKRFELHGWDVASFA